jgi:hypothetical protein
VYEDFIKDEELEQLESKEIKKNTGKTSNFDYFEEEQKIIKSKREEVLQRVKGLAITLELDDYNMYEIDYTLNANKIATNTSNKINTGNRSNTSNTQVQTKYKTEGMQFPESECKSTDTVKM